MRKAWDSRFFNNLSWDQVGILSGWSWDGDDSLLGLQNNQMTKCPTSISGTTHAQRPTVVGVVEGVVDAPTVGETEVPGGI